MKDSDLYMANLSFLLDYEDGIKDDEVEFEIFNVAFQVKESVHYDRIMGAGFEDLEQEPSNFASGLMFTSGLIESIYRINLEKSSNPFIVVGYNDIEIKNNIAKKDGEYLVDVKHRLLQDIQNSGSLQI